MFGYVIANTEALEQAEKTRYRAVYCGLCECLKQNYGQAGRLCLQYDFVFLILTLSAIYPYEGESVNRRCVMHILKPHEFWQSPLTKYAADLNILLAHGKLTDDIADEQSLAAKAKLSALLPAYEQAKRAQPEKAEAVTALLSELHEIEARREANPDIPANVFGRLMGELFRPKDDFFSDTLFELGSSLGRFVYIADAVCDLSRDISRGAYNPLISLHEQGYVFSDYRRILTDLIADCAKHFEMLPIADDEAILNNILYSGVFIRIDAAEASSLRKRREK